MPKCPLTFVKTTFWFNVAGCRQSIQFMDKEIKEVEDMQILVRQLNRSEENPNYLHVERGVFNFIGGISKI
jgi:hypothetical protein